MFNNYKKEEVEKFYNGLLINFPKGLTVTDLIRWSRCKSSDDDIKFAELAWKSIALTGFNRSGRYVQERILKYITDIENKVYVMVYFNELNEKK